MKRVKVVDVQALYNSQRLLSFGPFREGELVKSVSVEFLGFPAVLATEPIMMQMAMTDANLENGQDLNSFVASGMFLIEAPFSTTLAPWGGQVPGLPLCSADGLEIPVHVLVGDKRFLTILVGCDEPGLAPLFTRYMMLSVVTDSADRS